MFLIIEKSKETTCKFLQNAVTKMETQHIVSLFNNSNNESSMLR